jgi:hypothetical protein
MSQRFAEQDTLKHTKHNLRELRDMNNRPGRELLAYLLEMALIEVIMTINREGKPPKSTRAKSGATTNRSKGRWNMGADKDQANETLGARRG